MGTQFIKCYISFSPANIDPDALNYITAIELADGTAVESATRQAINKFVIGCKADGIWNAIKVCCILAGARTLAGALVPLKGLPPTAVNFTPANYSRKTGITRTADTQYINTNRAGNTDPLNNLHFAVYVSVPADNMIYLGSRSSSVRNSLLLFYVLSANRTAFFNNQLLSSVNQGISVSSSSFSAGFFGSSRSAPGLTTARYNKVTYTATQNPTTLASSNHWVLAGSSDNSIDGTYASGRGGASFYSIGESIDLSLLDDRVTQLMIDINNAF
jgi:hypothetical protein